MGGGSRRVSESVSVIGAAGYLGTPRAAMVWKHENIQRWIAAGEEVLITQKGLAVARLLPVAPVTAVAVDWAGSPEVRRDRSGETQLSAAESAALITEASGRW